MTDWVIREGVITDLVARDCPESRHFESFSMTCLQAGLRIRFQARGASMSPAIRDGETVYVKPASADNLRSGDIVLVKCERGFRMHRLIRADAGRDVFITRGDCGQQDDPAVGRAQILGVAVAKDVRIGGAAVSAPFKGFRGKLLRVLARGQAGLTKIAIAMRTRQIGQPAHSRRVS